MLLVGIVARREPDLAQGIVETGVFGDLGELSIVVDLPAGALFDRRNDEPPDTFGTQ